MATGTHARTLLDLIERCAADTPGRAALLAPGRRSLDYFGLADQVLRIARALADRGVSPRDAVAVSISNGPELAVAILGAAAAAAAAPLNPDATEFEVGRAIDDLAPRAAVVVGDNALRRVAARKGLPLLELVPGERAGEVAIAGSEPSQPKAREELDTTAIALVLSTSGTTAVPKRVPLSHGNLLAATARVAESLALSDADRCLNVMPLVHSHGLIGAFLSSLRAGGSIVCATAFDPREVLGWAVETQSTWTTAAPALYRALLEAPGAWPRLRLMRSASSPMPEDLAASLENRFSAPLVEAYGLTEAYQVTANPIGNRRRGSVGRPTGTEVAVADSLGAVLEPGETGEVLVRGPNVFQGYGADPDTNEEAFHDGWFRTGDTGHLDGDGYLTLTGRTKEIINRGGEKIAPREVEEALALHPAVGEAVCFPVADSLLGEEVGAVVVPFADAVLDPRELRRFAASRLAPSKVPRWFWVRDRMPVGAGGKVSRLTLAERLDLLPTSSQPDPLRRTASADPREELRSIWMEVIGLDTPPGDEERFFDVGGTSLGLVELMVAVERRFGVRLPLAAILEAPTIGELAVQIERPAGSGSERVDVERGEYTASVIPIQPAGSRPPLFIVAPAGGSVLSFYRLADRLGKEQPCYGLQITLRRRSWRVQLEVADIADAFLEGLERLGARSPWQLGGWSFGGFVAWEMAAVLRKRGEEVSHLVLVATDVSELGRRFTLASAVRGAGRAAQMFWYAKPFLRDQLHVRIAARLRDGSGDRGRRPLRRGLMNVLWKAGIENAKIAGHIERDPRLLELRTNAAGILGTLRHYVRAKRRYRPPLQSEVLDLIRAGRIDRGPPRRVREMRALGWERYATGRIRIHRLPGNHFTILSEDYVGDLAEAFRAILRRATRPA
ncbi:MAG: AMP-binding protein [Planctomycetota bacterium]|jgi:acyl-CoA synthetase (AMP-forming)/AMP-acid ligase II/thioesterase domain-containing protein/acyl carrier protein